MNITLYLFLAGFGILSIVVFVFALFLMVWLGDEVRIQDKISGIVHYRRNKREALMREMAE